MKKVKFAALAILMSVGLTSCYCDKMVVGNVEQSDTLVHVASIRNAHVLTGAIVTHEKVKNYVGETQDYVVANKRTFGDLLIAGLTAGIYTPTTTKFYVKKDNPNVVILKKKSGSKAYKGYLKTN